MIAFITELVPPGTTYEDEPSEAVPVGWHVRIGGLTSLTRNSPEWAAHWWPSLYLGPDPVDHVAGVVIAKIANDEWDHRGRAPEKVDESLQAAVRQLMERPAPPRPVQ